MYFGFSGGLGDPSTVILLQCVYDRLFPIATFCVNREHVTINYKHFPKIATLILEQNLRSEIK